MSHPETTECEGDRRAEKGRQTSSNGGGLAIPEKTNSTLNIILLE